MKDIRKERYALWLEQTLRELVEFGPERIAVIAMDKENNTATGYYNCTVMDKTVMAAVIQDDVMWDNLKENRDYLRALLEGEADEDCD